MRHDWRLSFLVGSFVVNLSSQAAPAPVDIETAFRSAVARSEVVKQGHERLAQVDAQRTQMVGGIYPNLAFNLSHVIQPEPTDPVARQFSPQHQTTMNFSLTQPVFRGLREFNGLKALTHLRSASEASQQMAVTRLFGDVSMNYLQILSLEQDLSNLAEQSDLYEKRLQDLTGRARRGESNQSDVVSAQSTQATLLAETRLIQGQLEVARETFHYLTGLARDAKLVDPDVVSGASGPSLDEYLQKVEQRPDVKAAREQLEASQKQISVAWGYHAPSLDLVGNYYLTRPGFFSDLKWDIGIRLTVPLFEGGATHARVTEALSKKREAELELARVRRAAQQEIRTIHQRLQSRLDHISKLKRSADLSRKNTELLRRDYQRGLARNIDVQLALTEFRVAQRSYDQARFSTQLDVYQLRASAGLVPVVSERKN